MKVLKFILIVLWVVATTLFIVGSLTPLEFRSKIVAIASFLIAFNGAFAMKFLLSDFARLKVNTVIMVFIVSIALLVTFYFSPASQGEWKTQEILYRNKENFNSV